MKKNLFLIILFYVFLKPSISFSLVEIDITRGNLDPMPISVSPFFSDKITDANITTAKVADDAITGAKIENTPSIANGLTLTDGNLTVADGHGIKFSVTSVLASLNGIAYEKDNGPIGLYQFTEIPDDDLILLESSELL